MTIKGFKATSVLLELTEEELLYLRGGLCTQLNLSEQPYVEVFLSCSPIKCISLTSIHVIKLKGILPILKDHLHGQEAISGSWHVQQMLLHELVFGRV